MYIDFYKFNYDILSDTEKSEYEARDKEAYLIVLEEWFHKNKTQFVERRWDIQEIHYLKKIGDFIALIREAERLYELGFYTACIALTGVSAEDFSKYLSLEKNKQDHITKTSKKGKTLDVSQSDRLTLQLNEGLINQASFDLFDDIRKIRNDCLHYNNQFKQKDQNQLKADAIIVLNNLKQLLKNIIGDSLDTNDFTQILNELLSTIKDDGFERVAWKQKNMFSHFFNKNITQELGTKVVYKSSIFKVTDIDDDEIDLEEQGSVLYLIVDLDDKSRNLLKINNIKIGDIIMANVSSHVAYDGQTRAWSLESAIKIHI